MGRPENQGGRDVVSDYTMEQPGERTREPQAERRPLFLRAHPHQGAPLDFGPLFPG